MELEDRIHNVEIAARRLEARVIGDVVLVDCVVAAPGGHRCLVLKLDEGAWAEVKKLPRALEFEGEVFVFTGWDSDRCEAYFQTGRTWAVRAA